MKISFMCPTPSLGSGGEKCIQMLANGLIDLGHDVTLYFQKVKGMADTQEKLDEILKRDLSIKFKYVLGWDNIDKSDVMIATMWNTAYPVAECIKNGKTKKGFYFIQDFEPWFYPCGEGFIKAEQSYRLGLHGIIVGDVFEKILTRDFNMTLSKIDYWIEDIYHFRPRTLINDKKKIALFWQPGKPRRCPDLGIGSLDVFNQYYPDVELITFGANVRIKGTFPYPLTMMGLLKQEELAELYSTVDCGICLCATNASIMTFEMMACGCPVVDIYRGEEYDKGKYYGRDNLVTFALPNEIDIAKSIEKVLYDLEYRNKIIKNGLEFVKTLPSVEQNIKNFERILVE